MRHMRKPVISRSARQKKREKIEKLREKWQKEKTSRKLIVGEGEIADVVSGWTKIPVRKLAEEESERLLQAGVHSASSAWWVRKRL